MTKWIQAHGHLLEVPCGKCLACLSGRRSDWAFRLEQEYKHSQGAVFVTLTYHPKFCPDFGLSKGHVQDYLKRLRKAYGDKLRYFAVGEYGTKTGRPHYHLIIFNYGEKDGRLETSIVKAWSTRKGESFGIVDIRNVNQARIMYVTKYLIQQGNAGGNNRSKPFMLCSRRYGLGAQYLTDQMVEWHRKNQFNYTMVHGEKRRLARYYRDKIWWPSPPLNGRLFRWREHPDRKTISEISQRQAKEREDENIKILKDAGYLDPQVIQAEMRNAVLGRVKQKVAFSQTL